MQLVVTAVMTCQEASATYNIADYNIVGSRLFFYQYHRKRTRRDNYALSFTETT